MARHEKPKPTEAELAILQVLWARGPSTVREVQDQLEGPKAVARTTVLKLLQIMYDKGLVSRDASDRTHIYRAAETRDKTEGRLLDDLLDRMFGGSTRRLVMRALSSKHASAEELDEIRRLLDERKDTRDE